MADEIRIDKNVFHARLSSFQKQWKEDRRSGNAVFGGVGSIIIVMGRPEDYVNYRKHNAFQVS